MPEVSVVIPSYNHAAYIAEAVQSVLDQTLTDLELIVVDDGSTDDSLEVLGRFNDPRLQIMTQENQGAHAAINRGLAAASSPYLAVLNSDDAYHTRRLEKLVAVLREDAAVGLAATHIQVVDAEGTPLGIKQGHRTLSPWPLDQPERAFRAGDDLRAALLTENYLATSSNFVFSRNGYRQAGAFRPLCYMHDWDFALRMAERARFVLVPEPLVQYRVHGRNTIRQDETTMLFELCWLLSVHLPRQTRSGWFQSYAPARQVEQLLHSIYTNGLDRVLVVMLLNMSHQDESSVLQLLEADDPRRVEYLAYIRDHLAT